MAARTKLNRRGVGELLRSAGVRDDLTTRMGRALSSARSNAPYDTGAYHNSLHVEQATTDRVVVRLSTGDLDYAFLVEANHGVLARALDAAR